MATAIPPRVRLDRAASARRVADPLQRLRSSIRGYVTAEGLAVLGLYLAVWFWVVLLLDYGFFKAFTIDWVQELPWGFRAGVLVVLSAGLVAVVVTKVLLRLFREFRDAALALVLERRYPRVLGDRLITAVELADPNLAEKYGFSHAMIDQTIADAVERVDQVSIKEVFDWQRLRRQGVLILLLTAGLYFLVAAAYCLFTWSTDVGRFAWKFNDVAAIWFERNILLVDTIWPRKAYLELLDFPGDEIRVGRDATPPTLRVRAVKWVIADKDNRKAPEGWRPLRWDDLTEELLGAPVPQESLPEPWREWTMDQIELQMEKPEARRELGDGPEGRPLLDLDKVFEQLHERAATSSMSRRLRELVIPDQVEANFSGATTSSEQTMPPGVNREYSGTVASLRESLRFTIRGEDYYTPAKRIIVVPPPSIVELKVDEDHPAYLYHRAPTDDDPKVPFLKGKKQKFIDRTVSLTGEKSSIQVPAGTDLAIKAKTDKALQLPGGVRFKPHKDGAPKVEADIEQVDENNFQVRFANVTAPIEFLFEFTDTDKVTGKRHVEVKPIHDTPPEVDVQVEVMRKVNNAYMVTPQALVPFSGKVRDDRGLVAVEFSFTVERVESQGGPGSQPALVATIVATPSGGGIPEGLLAVGMTQFVRKPAAPEAAEKQVKTLPVKAFTDNFDKQFLRALPRVRLEELFTNEPPAEKLLKDFDLDPDRDTFNVAGLRLKEVDERVAQPHYRLRLSVTATDNNVETGPRVGQSKEKFTFLVVSENELLAEIAKEEEGLHVKLEEALNRLKDAKIKLDKVAQELPEAKPDELSPLARRTEELQEAIVKSWDVAREVHGDYKRILKELIANQVRVGMIGKVRDKICDPLDLAINGDFVAADETMRELQKKLDAKTSEPKMTEPAQQRLAAVIQRLEGVLEAMGDVSNINKLISALLQIEKSEREKAEQLQQILRKKEEDILKELGGEKPKEK
jgi:hypothetical protein